MSQKIDDSTEKQLIAQAQKGDEKALEDLIKANLGLVYSFSFWYVKDRDNAEDVTQEVFVKVWKNLKKFDLKKGFRNWLLEIAKNTALDFLKKKETLPFSQLSSKEFDITETLVDKSPLPQEMVIQKDAQDLLEEALKKLSLEQQKIVRMHKYDDYTFQDIADLSRKSINTIKSQYRRAIILLRKLLSD
jgi:RNA polymerase sigma-70 factor (ECF subfamily)